MSQITYKVDETGVTTLDHSHECECHDCYCVAHDWHISGDNTNCKECYNIIDDEYQAEQAQLCEPDEMDEFGNDPYALFNTCKYCKQYRGWNCHFCREANKTKGIYMTGSKKGYLIPETPKVVTKPVCTPEMIEMNELAEAEAQLSLEKRLKLFRGKRSRGWRWVVYTDNIAGNDGDDYYQFQTDLESLDWDYYCYGFETCPTTGREHLQGYFYFKNYVAGTTIIKALHWTKIHLDTCEQGPNANFNYCAGYSEGKTPNEIFIFDGEFPGNGQGERTDLSAMNDMIASGKGLDSVRKSYPMQTYLHFRGQQIMQETYAKDTYEPPEVKLMINAYDAMTYLQNIYKCTPAQIFMDMDGDFANQYTHQKYGIIRLYSSSSQHTMNMLKIGTLVHARNRNLYKFKSVIFVKNAFLVKGCTEELLAADFEKCPLNTK